MEQSIKRVALIGSSSTGKSTVAELLKSKLPDFDFIGESTRTIASYGFTINEDGGDSTQLAISSFHLEKLLSNKNQILDRCYLDLCVYTSELENVTAPTLKYITDTWHRIKHHYTHYVYFPIEFNSVDDGVRSISEEWRYKVDEMFRSALYTNNLNHLTVTGSPLQRVNQILAYIK